MMPSPDQILEAVRQGVEKAFAPAGRVEVLMRKPALTPEEVQELYGYVPGTLSNWRSQGRGPRYIKDGSKVFYRREDVDAYQLANLKRTMV